MERPSFWLQLPSPALRVIFNALPVDERLRCREVCPVWRGFLDADSACWVDLDMLPAVALPMEAQGLMLRAAAARAHGTMRSLAFVCPSEPVGAEWLEAVAAVIPAAADAMVRDSEEDAATFRRFMDEYLLPVLRENRCALASRCCFGCLFLTRLATRPFSLTLQQLKCLDEVGAEESLQLEILCELLAAAPRLRELRCGASRIFLEDADAAAMLAREGPFAPVRLSRAFISVSGDSEGRDPVETLGTHRGMRELMLLAGSDASERAVARALDAAAPLGVSYLSVTGAAPVCCAALARVVRSTALRELVIANSSLTSARVNELAGALRDSALTKLVLLESKLFEENDGAQGLRLLEALTGHSTLENLAIETVEAALDDEGVRAAVSAALGALLAASTCKLKKLSLNGLGLDDESAQPLMDALRFNTHLEHIDLCRNHLSLQFYRRNVNRIRACASLHKLEPLTGQGVSDDQCSIEDVLHALELMAAAGQNAAQ